MLSDGTAVDAVQLESGQGLRATVITIGAALQSLVVPDRQGRGADVVLGFADAERYFFNPAYLGVTVGRYSP